jgi:hypothetical protein
VDKSRKDDILLQMIQMSEVFSPSKPEFCLTYPQIFPQKKTIFPQGKLSLQNYIE